jgi:hypothetical protein
MKKNIKILLLAILYLIVSGKSCVDNSARIEWEENQAEKAKDSIRTEFGTGYLPEENRMAAEWSAIQKLSDLADYIEIYVNHNMDIHFRSQAEKLIRNLFISPETRLAFGPVGKRKMKTSTLAEFLSDGFGKDIIAVKITFDSISVSVPLNKTSEDLYAGEFLSAQKLIAYTGSDSIIIPSQEVSVQFFSKRQNKVFGNDTIQTWEISLGNMKRIEK